MSAITHSETKPKDLSLQPPDSSCPLKKKDALIGFLAFTIITSVALLTLYYAKRMPPSSTVSYLQKHPWIVILVGVGLGTTVYLCRKNKNATTATKTKPLQEEEKKKPEPAPIEEVKVEQPQSEISEEEEEEARYKIAQWFEGLPVDQQSLDPVIENSLNMDNPCEVVIDPDLDSATALLKAGSLV